MKSIFILFSITFLFSFSTHPNFQLKGKINNTVDYFNVPGPLIFDSNDYYLRWSANPQNGYYKQEYLRKKDDYPEFNRMLLLEYQENVNPDNALRNKVKELEARKKSDPVLQYEIIKSPDGKQFIIDFMVSSGDIYEWNVYKIISNKNGNLLLGFCLRSARKGELSGNTFFNYLKKNRLDLINKMIETKVPKISLSR